MNRCAMHGCHGTLKLRGVDAEAGAALASYRCEDCSTEHVQPVIVIASTTSGHGRTGRARFANPV